MRYADWSFYIARFHGESIPEADFPRLAARASRALDALTFGRIDKTYARCPDVAMACCAVCDVLWAEEQSPAPVTRERLDSYEVAYAPRQAAPLNLRILQAARLYLWRTGLLSMAVQAARREGYYHG